MVKFLFHLPSCLPRVNTFFLYKNDHLREWKPVLVVFQNSCQVLEMQLQFHRSQITIKQSFAVPTASSTEVYCYASSILLLPAVEQNSSILILPSVQQYSESGGCVGIMLTINSKNYQSKKII